MSNDVNHGSELVVKNYYNLIKLQQHTPFHDALACIFDQHIEYTKMLAHQRPNNICAELDSCSYQTLSIADIANFMLYMSHALQDEVHEMVDSLGGIQDGVGSGSWKMWKKSHEQAKAMTLKDLSDRDRQNLYMEIADMAHFFFSMVMATGMTAQDFYNYFITKSQENIDRQKRGY